MKHSPLQMPALLDRCRQIRREILALSGVPEAGLDEVVIEMGLHYATWCADYKGPELADPFMEFQQLILDWPSPWGFISESSLNGFTLSQFNLVHAYDHIQVGLGALEGTPSHGRTGSVEEAACNAIFAVRFLMLAKHLTGTVEDRLAQATEDEVLDEGEED